MLKKIDLTLEIRDTLGLFLSIDQLALALFNLISEVLDVIHLLLIVNLTLLQGRFLNFNLLIKKMELFISLDELCRQNISLIHDHLIIFLLLGFFSFSLRNDILQASYVILLRLNHLLGTCDLLLDLSDRFVELGVLLDI